MDGLKDDFFNQKLEWKVSVPILANKHILKQLFWVFQIAIIFVLVLTFLIQAIDPYTKITLDFLKFLGQLYFILLAVLSVCLILGYLITIGLRYDFIFSMDESGIKERPGRKQGRKNKITNTILVIGGLLSRSPGLAGAGIIAQSRQQNFVSWRDINKIEDDPKSRTIILKKNKQPLMMVFCTKENYQDVLNKIKVYLGVQA